MRFLAALACAVIVQWTAASAQTYGDSRLDPMASHYAGLTQAYANNDPAMILAYRTPDFYVETPSGDRIDTAAASQILVDFLAQNQPPIEMRTEILCARMAGESEAVFTVTQRLGRTITIDGQGRRLESAMTQFETWRLTSNGWRLASVTNMRDPRRWLDGTEVSPFGPLDARTRPYFYQPSGVSPCPQAEPAPGLE